MIRLKSLLEWKFNGSVWKTTQGKIAAKNRRGKIKYGFKTVQSAREFAHTGTTHSSENVIPEDALPEASHENPPMGNFPPSNDPATAKTDEIPTQSYQTGS